MVENTLSKIIKKKEQKLNELKKIIKTNAHPQFLGGGTDLSLKVTKNREEIQNI